MSLDHVRSLLVDLDGCVWFGEELAPGARDFVASARGAGLRLGFLTNISTGSSSSLSGKLTRLGIPTPPEDVFMPINALPSHPYLADRPATYVLGRPQVVEDVAAHTRVTNDPELATLVVLSRDPELDYRRLSDATHVLHRGGRLLALNLDARVPVEGGRVLPGNGSIAAALTVASGVEADVVGKPSPRFFRAAMERFGMDPRETAMVGDSLDSDVLGGNEAGLPTVHVGGDTFSALTPPPVPTVSVPSLADLAPLLGIDLKVAR